MKKAEMEKILQNIQGMTYSQIIDKYPYFNPCLLMAVRKGYIRKKRELKADRDTFNRFSRKLEIS